MSKRKLIRIFGPTVIDQIFEPFERFDAIMENTGGPEIIGLYAPV